MNYDELTEQEKRIYDYVYALQYVKHGSAYHAIQEAQRAIEDLRYENKRKR